MFIYLLVGFVLLMIVAFLNGVDLCVLSETIFDALTPEKVVVPSWLCSIAAGIVFTVLWLPIIALIGIYALCAGTSTRDRDNATFEAGNHTSHPEYDRSEDQGPGAYRGGCGGGCDPCARRGV